MEKQVYIKIQCDTGKSASFLRKLADLMEENEDNIDTYELAEGIAEVEIY